jgi:hypothetical protein
MVRIFWVVEMLSPTCLVWLWVVISTLFVWSPYQSMLILVSVESRDLGPTWVRPGIVRGRD